MNDRAIPSMVLRQQAPTAYPRVPARQKVCLGGMDLSKSQYLSLSPEVSVRPMSLQVLANSLARIGYYTFLSSQISLLC